MVENNNDDEQELYDEFGNYIGPDLDEDEDDESEEESDIEEQEEPQPVSSPIEEETSLVVVNENNNQIVLHEDKEHYESAEAVFGEDVKAVVLDEDAMDIDTPIVEPLRQVSHTLKDSTEWIFDDDYLSIHLSNETTRNRRGVAIVGHLHHGKTSLVDLLLEPTILRAKERAPQQQQLLDNTKAEQERRMSLVSTPITTVLPDSRGKTHAVTLVDCPGHPQFHDDTVATLALVDGVVLVVDVVEGVQLHTKMCIQNAIAQGLPISLVISKFDRLIVELKLPPNDAYFQLRNVIASVNQEIQSCSRNASYPLLSPDRNNVAFASAQHGFLFTCRSFAELQNDHSVHGIDISDFSKRLWGDCYLDPSTGQFQTSPRECRSIMDDSKPIQRTFVQFVLEPIYKIYTQCLGEHSSELNSYLRSIGVLLNKEQLRASASPLLKSVFTKFFTSTSAWVDMVIETVPHPAAAAPGKLARTYTGEITKYMQMCDPNGPLVMHCTKQYYDGTSFWTFGRIYSGTIRPAETVKVLGEGYNENDAEDVSVATVAAVAIPRGRSYMHVNMAKAGNYVLLQGVDSTIAKTATIVSNVTTDTSIFAPLKFPGEAVVKLAIEPLNPAELPKMVEGLRRISKAYPISSTKVEESGEHVVMGTGELYMDCLMHDLRHVYSDVEVKIADPIVAFRETVIETSSLKCFAETANKRNKLTMIAEPMDEGLAEQLELGKIKLLDWDEKKTSRFFQTKYNWDLLSSRSVWAFGDSPSHGTNILMDDTLPSEVDKSLMNSCRNSIVQGFQWAMREGPLCEEPVRAAKLKLLDVTLADKPIYRGGGQVIPTARRTVHSALLTATPRLMEPVYRLEITCPGSLIESIQPVLARRRGHIVQDRPISGTTLFSVKGFMPVLDSFGFETDLRTFTQGQAMVHCVFDHWSVVPGDPLDKDIILHPLEPSPPNHLAREILIKTRRRKGLSEDVSMTKFFDEGMKNYLKQQEEPTLQ